METTASQKICAELILCIKDFNKIIPPNNVIIASKTHRVNKLGILVLEEAKMVG